MSSHVIPVGDFFFAQQYKEYFKRKRWTIFIEKGTACWYCNLRGNYVVFWSDNPNIPWDSHIDLAHIDEEGNRTMFTLDHFIPKSKGGSNNSNNLVPACNPCNHIKKDDLPKMKYNERY